MQVTMTLLRGYMHEHYYPPTHIRVLHECYPLSISMWAHEHYPPKPIRMGAIHLSLPL